MLDRIEQLKTEVSNVIVNNSQELEQFRLKYLSRKGIISDLFEEFKNVDKSQKGLVGKKLNELKNLAQNYFDEKKQEIDEVKKTTDIIDYTLPGRTYNLGSKHLITQALEDISRIFEKIGFKVADGSEIED